MHEPIEPMGLLYGPAAAAAVLAGHAVWLAGGPLAFALVRTGGRIAPVHSLPSADLRCLTQPRPPWAGLPVDRPAVMGIVNVTPDSFSDPGRYAATQAAIAAGRAMAAAGADVVDVGGESTRPGSQPTALDTELARVLPVVRALVAEGIVVSIDSRNAPVMAAALDAGARIVNDVSALTHDPDALKLVAARRCPVVLMHMRGTPATMQGLTEYADVALDVTRELAARLEVAVAAGIDPASIAIDPGIGFAKAAGQNEELLARLPVLHNLGCRVLVGLSRKGFIGRLSGETDPLRRLPGSLAGAMLALSGGASILRVHDVAETMQAVRVWQGIAGAAGPRA